VKSFLDCGYGIASKGYKRFNADNLAMKYINNVVSSAKEKSTGRDSSRLTIFSFLLKKYPA
jgi:hypothetical protein